MRPSRNATAASAILASLAVLSPVGLSAATSDDVIRLARGVGVEILHDSASRIHPDGRLVLDAPRLVGQGLVLAAEQLEFDPSTLVLRLTGVEFLAPGEGAPDRTGSWTRAAQVRFSDPRALHLLGTAPACPSDGTEPRAPEAGPHVQMDGLQVSPITASGLLSGSERLTVASVRIDLGDLSQVGEGMSCTPVSRVDASGILAIGADRSALTLERLLMTGWFSGDHETGPGPVGRIDMTSLSLMHPGGAPAALISEIRVEGSVSRMPEIPSTLRPRALLASLLTAQGDLRVDVQGVSIDPGGLPVAGQAEGDRQERTWIRGGISGSVVKSETSLSGHLSIDLSHLLSLQAEGVFDIAPADQLPALSGILGDLPAADFLGRLSFRSMTFRARDLGVVEVTAPLTGYSREVLMARLQRVLSAMPATISGPVTDFAQDVFTTGAGVQAIAPQPVLLVQAMMMGLIQPDRLGDVLGVARIP